MHTEQLKLSGMDDTQIKEAANAVQQSVGYSAYLHGVGYNVEQFKREVDSIINHIKSQAKAPVGAKK